MRSLSAWHDAGAALEWLPALDTLHGGARVELRRRFELAPGAGLLARDLLGQGLDVIISFIERHGLFR